VNDYTPEAAPLLAMTQSIHETCDPRSITHSIHITFGSIVFALGPGRNTYSYSISLRRWGNCKLSPRNCLFRSHHEIVCFGVRPYGVRPGKTTRGFKFISTARRSIASVARLRPQREYISPNRFNISISLRRWGTVSNHSRNCPHGVVRPVKSQNKTFQNLNKNKDAPD
jgi:hypothetical protein